MGVRAMIERVLAMIATSAGPERLVDAPSDSPLPVELGLNAFERFAERVVFAAVDVGFVAVLVGIVFSLYRVVRGPTLVDRSIGTDLVSFLSIALVVLLTIRLETLIMFDAVLVVSILGFISTLAFAQFIGRRGGVR